MSIGDPEPESFTRHSYGGEIVSSYGIAKWLMDAREAGATHMVVVCDTWDFRDFPVLVMPEDDVRKVVANYVAEPMYKVQEVYWLEGDLDKQLEMYRSFTYGPDDSDGRDFTE